MKIRLFVLTSTALCSSDEHGDRPRPAPVVDELKSATDVFERKSSPAWAYEVFYFTPQCSCFKTVQLSKFYV
jgi:hypothetical protein